MVARGAVSARWWRSHFPGDLEEAERIVAGLSHEEIRDFWACQLEALVQNLLPE